VSYRRSGGLGEAILSIGFLAAICFQIGAFALRFFGVGHPDGVATFIGGAAILTVIVCLVVFAVRLTSLAQANRVRWASCPHGVRGGKQQNLCAACAKEKRLAEETARRQQEGQARQRQINAAAAELKGQETARLHQSILLTLDELRRLTPQRFEDEIAMMFRRLGYQVEQTPYSNDMGRDAIMWKDNEKSLLECKKYDQYGLSGRPDLQKFHSAIISDSAKKGYFVTTGSFTKGAREFAAKERIAAIDGHMLVQVMLRSNPKGSTDDSYQSMCRECGKVVRHHLRAPEEVRCQCCNMIAPTLNVDKIVGAVPNSVPTCVKCGVPMRLVSGKNGKFWGCSDYPRCRSTKPFSPTKRPSAATRH
jgi:HJR/Mrr/RecB family endonuclease